MCAFSFSHLLRQLFAPLVAVHDGHRRLVLVSRNLGVHFPLEGHRRLVLGSGFVKLRKSPRVVEPTHRVVVQRKEKITSARPS